MKKYIAIAASLFLVSLPAAAYRGGLTVAPLQGNTGSAQINIGAGDAIPANFINILKMATMSFSGGATPGTAALDQNGYPTQSFTGLVSLTFNAASWSSSYTIIWSAATQLQMTFAGVNTGCSTSGSGGSFTGCAGGNMTVTINGTGAGSLTWTPSLFSIQLPGTATYGAAGTANVAIVRNGDVPAYNTYSATSDVRGTYTPEFVSLVKGLGPKTIRPMGWVDSGGNNLSTDALWIYRVTPSNLSWASANYFPLNVWSGGTGSSGAVSYTASGTCNGSSTAELYTASPTIDQPSPSGTPPYGTVVQGVIANANTTTSPLLCFGTTAFPIWSGKNAAAPTVGGSGSIFAGSFNGNPGPGTATFIFDPTLGVWLYWNSGLTSTIPVEDQIILANGVGANLHATIPFLADDNYVTQMSTTALQLSSYLYFLPEYSNEVWNNGFPQTKWAAARGLAFGFPASGGSGGTENIHGWYGLRARQIMGNIIPPIWSGRNLRRVFGFQAAASFTPIDTYRMGGFDLAPSGVGTGIGNSLYCTYTGGTFSGACSGGANYTAAPNRPIDVVETIAYAPYAGGANLMNGADIAGGATPNALNSPYYQTLVNDWEAGSTSAAIALVDDDIRQGRTSVQTVTCSGTTFTTPSAHGFANNSSQIAFQVTGGTSYSGLTTGALYRVSSVPTSTTFTMQGFVNGFVSGSNINCGTAGSGTVTVGWVGNGNGSQPNFQTMQAVANSWELNGENIAASFDGSRPVGMSPLRVEQYEGNLEPVGPTPAQCAGLGITTPTPITVSFTATSHTNTSLTGLSSVTGLINGMVISGGDMGSNAIISAINPTALTASLSVASTGSNAGEALTATGNCGTDIASAITAWKLSSSGAATQTLYFKQFEGLDSSMAATFGLMVHSKTPAQLVLGGTVTDANNPASNAYGFLNGGFPNSQAFQTYTGFAAFNGVLN